MENKDKLYLHINVVMDRDTDKQEYFWNKISSYLESMGMECLGSSEYQPLERIQEETKESNSTPLEPLQNGEREELDNLINTYGLSIAVGDEVARDDSFRRIKNYFISKISQSKEESYQSGCEDMLRDTCAKITLFIESESGKSGRKEILKFVKSLTNQKKEDE